MGNWSHEGHDRRRGPLSVLDGKLARHFLCLDCKTYGMTQEDISHWPEYNEGDYWRHMEWLDPEAYAWFNEETS